MKKFLAMILALVMALGVTTTAWAEDSHAIDKTDENSALVAAIEALTPENPVLTLTEGMTWPTDYPVYYNGKFYKGDPQGTHVGKGALEYAIIAANEANSSDVAKICVSPNYKATEDYLKLVQTAHQPIMTSIAIYGNNASLDYNWEPCVEYPGTSPDNGAHQLTKDISVAMYNLNGGAGFWGNRVTGYKVDLIMENCKNAHEFMFYGNKNDAQGATNITVKNCTFDATNKNDHNVICIIGAGDITVENSTFKAANINLKNVNGGDNTVTVKNTQFTDTVAGNQNIRIRGYEEDTEINVTIESVSFEGASEKNIEIGQESKGTINYTIKDTAGKLNLYEDGAAESPVAKTIEKGEIVTNVTQPETPPRYYYNSTTTTDTKKDETKGSPKTFDAGVGIYALTAVLSVTGMAYVGKKKF